MSFAQRLRAPAFCCFCDNYMSARPVPCPVPPVRSVAGLVGSYEVTRNEETGLWHPHVHVILLCEGYLPDFPFELRPETRKARNGSHFVPDWEWEAWQREFVAAVKDCGLVREWSACTGGDSSIVDLRPMGGADWVTTSLDHLAGDFAEVFKYAVKYSTMSPEATVEVYQKLSGCRLIFSAGCFRGVEVPEDLVDDFSGLADLPYVERFYDYLPKVGYNLRWCRLLGMSPARFWKELALQYGTVPKMRQDFSENIFIVATSSCHPV